MPLLIERSRISPRRQGSSFGSRFHASGKNARSGDGVRVALINNMPDAALEDTETQFFELLDTASGLIPVRLSLYSLPNVPRGPRALKHIQNFYHGIDELWDSGVDAVIVTGTEPRQADLRKEPYWQALAEVFDWAERHTVSAVLSCLAAHAGVLHSDGIPRQPLGDKLFGVFESSSEDHVLTRHAAEPLRFPHSRWNDVREKSLTSCGYSILTRSPQAGADLFVKRRKKSSFVHFQGHPEYSAQTLLKEYRRDVKRFLRGERSTYPTMPQGYFDVATAKVFGDFQKMAIANPEPAQADLFPDASALGSVQASWHSTATCIYRNWLQYIVARIERQSAFVAVAQNGRAVPVSAGSELS